MDIIQNPFKVRMMQTLYDRKITGTLIKNYFHCKRQAYLYYYGLNFSNEIVRIGEIMHIEHHAKEYVFEKVKVDDIQDNSVIEFKKTSANEKGTYFQVLWYLKYFKDRGVILKGKIIDLTFHKKKTVVLNELNEKELNHVIEEISEMLTKGMPKRKKYKKECKGCSFFDYCWSE